MHLKMVEESLLFNLGINNHLNQGDYSRYLGIRIGRELGIISIYWQELKDQRQESFKELEKTAIKEKFSNQQFINNLIDYYFIELY